MTHNGPSMSESAKQIAGSGSQSHRLERPSLRPSSMAGGSFLRDHEQYKPATPIATPPAVPSLKSLLWAPRNRLVAPLPLNFQTPGPTSAASPASASVSSLQSTAPAITPQICVKKPSPVDSKTSGQSEKSDVADNDSKKVTITDSGITHSIFSEHESATAVESSKLVATLFYNSDGKNRRAAVAPPAKSPLSGTPVSSAPSTQSTTVKTANSASDLQPLDKYYGPFITQLCLASFLQLIDSMSTPYHRIHSSHRCLDLNEKGGDDHPRVVEVTVAPPPIHPEYFTFADMRKHEDIHRFEETWNVQLVLQPESVFRRYKRLAVFDMDSTLIEQEVIDEIAKFIGVEAEVSRITERAMNGELDFTASLRERVSLLKGVPADVFDQLKPKIRITRGARQLCRALKTLGYKMAVLSGGFQPLADWLAGELGLDYAYANHLEVDQATQKLTGRLLPTSTHPIISPSRKRELLMHLAEINKIPLSQVVAVGDGANDLPMLHTAGLGVAWNAKEKVQLEAPTRLNGESLVDLLFLLGLGRTEIDELTGQASTHNGHTVSASQ